MNSWVAKLSFSSDVTVPSAPHDGFQRDFDSFQREWAAQVGQPFSLAGLDIGKADDIRFNAEVAIVHDAVIADVNAETPTGRTTVSRDSGDWVSVYLVRRGEWQVTPLGARGETITATAGSFSARYCRGPQSWFLPEHGTAGTLLLLPAPVFEPLIGNRHAMASMRSAEVRVLSAHAGMVGETARALTPAGARAARDALFELVRGALRREFDDVEPRLAPALARAAMEVAEHRLTDPELSPASLARELNVSVRTLNRAFATADESVAAYVRRRRLERARLELTAPRYGLSISEIAARWQFADSSHFARSFKSQYAQTPSEFVRTKGTNG